MRRLWRRKRIEKEDEEDEENEEDGGRPEERLGALGGGGAEVVDGDHEAAPLVLHHLPHQLVVSTIPVRVVEELHVAPLQLPHPLLVLLVGRHPGQVTSLKPPVC